MSSDHPVVDVIVAVHNDRRPIERAVGSTLATTLPIRVTVVAHNVSVEAITARLGALADDERVRVLGLADGVRSPANAFNHGLDAATAEFVTIVGSDDTLEPGAIDSWVAQARRHDADAVIAPVIRDDGHGIPTPRVRPGPPRILDLDRDRLFERTAALGLQRRETTKELRYTDGLPRGVDQAYGLRLWASARAVFDIDSPGYREHGDQADRVTHAFGALEADFAFLDGFLDVLVTQHPAVRRAVVAKVIRVHLIPAVRNRVLAATFEVADLRAAAAILARLSSVAPGAPGLLPRGLTAELKAIEHVSMTEATAATRRRASRVAAVVPRSLRLSLHRHAPLRSMLAGRIVARHVSAAFASRRDDRNETR